MEKPDLAEFGAEPLIKQHQFSTNGLSGVLVFSVDQGPVVRKYFSHEVQLAIWVCSSQEKDKLPENNLFSNVTSASSRNFRIPVCAQAESIISSESVLSHRLVPSAMLEDQHIKPSRRSRRIQRKTLQRFIAPHSNDVKSLKMQESENESGNTVCEIKSKYTPINPTRTAGVNKFVAEIDGQDESLIETESVEELCQEEAVVADDKKETNRKCQYCETEFATLRDFYDHRRSEGSTHCCSICGKVELFKAHLIVHMQRHGKEQLEDTAEESDLKSDIEVAKRTKQKMKCTICGLVVSSLDSLKTHTMLHTGESSYLCCVCGDKFSSLSSRQHHMDTHVTAQRFRCVQCNVRFSSRAELAKHQLNHNFECSICGEQFPNKTSRTCHYRVAHPQDILRCGRCPALFSSPESLQRHQQYHARGLKQQCPTCGLVVSKLKEHMLLHSPTPPARIFVCDQCPMSYLRKSNLDRHMRTHTGEKPYACSHCSKCFCSNGMLRKHLLTHTLERPFQCDVCGKRCALRSNLDVHMRIHSSDRRFSCSICGQRFNHKNSLQGHLRSKHPKQSPRVDPVVASSSQVLLSGLPSASHQIHFHSASGLDTMSNALPLLESRSDYTQYLQLNYTAEADNGLLDTAQPAVSLSGSLNHTSSNH